MAFSLNPLRMKLPVKLVLIILGVIFFGQYLSLDIKQFCFAISLSLKAILEFFLPVIIFSYLSSCILSFKKGVLTFVIILLSTVYISNLIGTLVGYGSFLLVFDKISSTNNAAGSGLTEVLTPLWSLNLPKLLSNDWALYIGLLSGICFSFIRSFAQNHNKEYLLKIYNYFETFTHILQKASSFFLLRLFIPFIPLFILGFIINLQHTGILNNIATSYGPIFLFIVSVQTLYALFLFVVVAKFNFNLFYTYLRNTIPAIIAGFSTMSSIAAMPLTLLAAEKNTGNPTMARVLIPATVNIHMIGNTIGIPMMAISCLATFGVPLPDFQSYLLFGLSFALAQFAVTAVPGGGIFIMIPLMEKFLGFTPEMISIITTLNILLDAPVTASSIVGNSSLAIFLNKIFTKLKIS